MKPHPGWVVVAPDTPCPPTDGGRVEVHSRLLMLQRLGVPVHLVCTAWGQPQPEHLEQLRRLVASLHVYPRVMSPATVLAGRTPFQVASRSARVLPDLDRLAGPAGPLAGAACVLVEGLYAAGIGLALAERLGCPCILRSHNMESEFYREVAGSAPLHLKPYYYSEAWRLRGYERRMLPRFPLILSISRDEVPQLQELAPRSTVEWLPPYANIPDAVSRRDDGRTLLYVGALDRPNNLFGLRWFVDRVWTAHARLWRGARFLVVGRNPGPDLAALCARAGIELHANVPDVRPFYEQATAVVNPIFHGAGVNIKTVEAVGHGRPLLTTSKGTRGTGLDRRHVFVADRPGEFAAALLEIMSDRSAAEARAAEARRFVIEQYRASDGLQRLVGRFAPGRAS